MDGGQRRTETWTSSRMERVSRVEPAAVRHAGGERSAQHRFPRGAAGIDKGSAAAPFVPFTAQMIYEEPVPVVNGTLPPMPHTRPIAGWRLSPYPAYKTSASAPVGPISAAPSGNSALPDGGFRLIRPTKANRIGTWAESTASLYEALFRHNL